MPILLLGDESIEAEHEIEEYTQLLERSRQGTILKRDERTRLLDSLGERKTEKSREIRQLLSIDPFTATHLNMKLDIVKEQPSTFLLSDEELESTKLEATANDTDRLELIELVSLSPDLDEAITGVSELLMTKPTMANVLDYLAENPDVSKWVRTGINLHEDINHCEFCGAELNIERIEELRAHFSKDIEDLEYKLQTAKESLENAKIEYVPIHERLIYATLREEFLEAQSRLISDITNFNSQLDLVIETIDIKLDSIFDQTSMSSIDNSCCTGLGNSITSINEYISTNNNTTQNFDEEKTNAIDKMVRHLAAQFIIDFDIQTIEERIDRLERHKNVYSRCTRNIESHLEDLVARISNAQKGKDELNQLLAIFLSGSNIEIEVINTEDGERFRLTRNSEIAKHLSEGEKTAIAFSFFLAKLKESDNFEDLVIFIDDPISSLDNNHIFQLNSLIKDFFFFQDSEDNNMWKLKNRQIFFSTHNFEFLSLLKELPIRKQHRCKFYFIKRTDIMNATFTNMPTSIKRYSSEYQYLWNVVYSFYISENKDDLEILLALPNAIRRFVELYTYTKIPCSSNQTVGYRADKLFGSEKSLRICKVFHYFSHSNNIQGLARNSDLICDIENVVNDLIEHVRLDEMHYQALMDAIDIET